MSDAEVEVDAEAFAAAGTDQKRKLRQYRPQLLADPFLGNRIQRELVPQRFRDLPNLFRIELPEGWRALYTVATRPGGARVVRIVWIGNHTRYDRLFGYG